LRNEAHRFAILHHRKARAKEGKLSELSRIEGVGDIRRKLLMKKFKGIERIKKATVEDIEKVVNNRRVAIKIVQYFNPSLSPEESKQ
jgi:excinuclease ABC subunit C